MPETNTRHSNLNANKIALLNPKEEWNNIPPSLLNSTVQGYNMSLRDYVHGINLGHHDDRGELIIDALYKAMYNRQDLKKKSIKELCDMARETSIHTKLPGEKLKDKRNRIIEGILERNIDPTNNIPWWLSDDTKDIKVRANYYPVIHNLYTYTEMIAIDLIWRNWNISKPNRCKRVVRELNSILKEFPTFKEQYKILETEELQSFRTWYCRYDGDEISSASDLGTFLIDIIDYNHEHSKALSRNALAKTLVDKIPITRFEFMIIYMNCSCYGTKVAGTENLNSLLSI